MANFALALKEEIRRLARKEIKSQTLTTVRAVSQYRREIAILKRQFREQQKKIALLETQERKSLHQSPENGEVNGQHRFSARSVKTQRSRIGFSAAGYAKLVGVSALTVYNWENGKSRPRKEQLSALAAVRGIGKREATERLEQLNGRSAQRARRRSSKRKSH